MSARLVLATLLLMAGPAWAQVPRQPDPPPRRDPTSVPGVSQGILPGAGTAPVVPDTASVELELAADSPRPTAIDLAPVPVDFGEIVALVLSYPAGQEPPLLANEPPVDWLEYAPEAGRDHLDRLEAAVAERDGRPSGTGTVVVPVRIYRTDPFVLASGDVRSPVIEVRGRTTDLSGTAAIRQPRQRGWNLLVIAALAVSIVLLGLLLWVLWRRRNAPAVIEDWQPAPPGWLGAAIRLRDLLERRDPERGAGRAFLDELAAVVRAFLADRYGVAAREMTGAEIVAACRHRGFELEPVRALARLLEEADRCRYDPEPVTTVWARDRAAELIGWMRELRIRPRQTPVGAAEMLEAERAWAALEEYLKNEGATAAALPGEAE